jgi:hypothetical protein
MPIIRKVPDEISVADARQDKTSIDAMVAYFQRQTDQSQARSEIVKQYGTFIREEKDPEKQTTVTSYTSWQEANTEIDQTFLKKVNTGIVAAVPIGFGHRVTNAHATMFTERGHRFSLSHESIKDPKKAEELLREIRSESGFESAINRWDKRSVECASAALLTTYDGDGISYHVKSPSDVDCYFPDAVLEDINGEQRWRAVDRNNIEDAYLAVVRLSQVDATTWNYLAIYGRSENKYPKGRYVIFSASDLVTEIPEVGSSDDVYDYKINGEICNPLSYVADENKDLDLPEYPISVLYGGTTDVGGVMPVSESLYRSSLSIDVAASHLLGTSQDAAQGMLKFKRETPAAASQPLPDKVIGAADLPPGVDAEHVDFHSSASKDAMDVLKEMMIQTGAGFGVPDYMVVTEDHTLDASSGVALAIKTRPLRKYRDSRIEENTSSVLRQFEVERSLLHLYYQESDEKEGRESQLWECSQTWDPGELILPENKKESAERLTLLMDKGIIDTIAAIREHYQLPSDDEAIEMYDKMKGRKEEYPPLLKEEEPPPVSNVGFKRKKKEPPNAQPR